MRIRKIIFLVFTTSFFLPLQSNAQEWRKFYGSANIDKFRVENIKLGLPAEAEKRVVFMGNSIIEAWPILRPDFFKDTQYIARGLSGQTTPQMLLRFRTDVISLQPKVVVILAGINDIAQNTGFIPIELIAENIMTMAELARYHNIEVIICSVVPAIDFPWKRGLEPANKILELNLLLKEYATKNDLIYVDYHSKMADEKNGLKVPEYTAADDLVHPNEAGYTLMGNLVQPAIEQAISQYTKRKERIAGPLYKNHKIKGKKLVLDFNFKGTGLVSKESKLIGFEIAGADKKFVQATAKIKRNRVYLSARKITKPMYARYGWKEKGLGSLTNKEGLSATAFTTE